VTGAEVVHVDTAVHLGTAGHFAHMSPGHTVDSRRVALDHPVTREWAWGGSTGAGVRVCLVDSGVDETHPDVGVLAGGLWTVERSDDVRRGRFRVIADDRGDVAGHGTACVSIIRRLAPEVDLTSVRIVGARLGGDGGALIAALRWAVEQRFDLINVSLSTRRHAFKEELHDLVDHASFAGGVVVASAHNSPVDSYPWRFASVISTGSHARSDPWHLEVNSRPPVDFFAAGVNIDAARPGGGRIRVSGNSFAAPHVTGLLAVVRSKHPHLGPAQLRHVLTAISNNLSPSSRVREW
jgi:subtilisin family serine protease